MPKKNIWIINQYTGSSYYGMNYRSYYLAKEFVSKGHEVTIFSGSYSHLFTHYPKTKGLFTKEHIAGISYIWVKTPQYKSSKSIGRVFNMFMFMINLTFFNIFKVKKPDTIIVSSLSLFPVLNAYLWSKIFKIDFIFEIRDIWPLTLIEVGGFSKWHPLVLFLGFFEKLGYKKAKYVVSLLPHAKAHFLSRGMQEDKFKYIPNGINLDEVENYEDTSIEIDDLIPKDKFIIAYVGTLGIANALDTFIESAIALRDKPKIHFVLVGKGGEKKALEKKALEQKLINITFIPPVPKIQVQGVLKRFDICYIGLKKEKLFHFGVSPNKLFDYMYASKPILFAIETKESLVNVAGGGISIPSENVKALSKAILSFEQMSQDELRTLGENAKRYVVENHTYNSLSEKYLELV